MLYVTDVEGKQIDQIKVSKVFSYDKFTPVNKKSFQSFKLGALNAQNLKLWKHYIKIKN